jgi:precorrin-6Y C5,15-methyltransferase (decarboxylating)
MSTPIDVIGLGADGPAGLRPGQLERIHAADFLAGGERHLAFFPEARGERFPLKGDNLDRLLGELARRWEAGQRCVVLASGDPLFYGVGTQLVGILGPAVHVEPALSSMQLAFARAGVAWQTAALASIHGRDLRTTLLPLLGRRLIGLFTQDGDSPAAVARFFLERGLPNYEAVVGENLGAPNERVTRWENLHRLAEQRFAPLNYLVLIGQSAPEREPPVEAARRRALVPGVSDDVFARPADAPEVMTRQELRSVVLAKLAPGAVEAGGVVWDIGAGLGTVAVEVAVLRPEVEVVAVERDPGRAAFLRQNRERFGAYNVRVIEGEAPDALRPEPLAPRAVFIGGSGPHLSAILDLAAERLQAGGRLVANFVTLEHLQQTLERVRAWGWPVEVTQVQVARSDALAGLTGLKPQRGVFLVSTQKPGASA